MSNLAFSTLMKCVDLDVLYQLLFLSNRNLPTSFNEMLSDYIGGLSIYFARKYQIREFALSILIALNIRKYFENTFFEDAVEFLEYIQTNLGYFGYDDPFSRCTNDVNQKILNSFYSIMALENLYDRL
ncbi:hypothetical protein [Streptococcus sp. NLN76]|uniref:hypothetical protein n=1 Tax=Streptococcus sp. NLN76 TaxID=2822800 RepID=UPI0018AC7D28|nr:hypothetical protein [Streptococcus sp. NLN76]MBF8971155.1 hypothetical protein [Streptococcus sp. NLN76]